MRRWLPGVLIWFGLPLVFWSALLLGVSGPWAAVIFAAAFLSCIGAAWFALRASDRRNHDDLMWRSVSGDYPEFFTVPLDQDTITVVLHDEGHDDGPRVLVRQRLYDQETDDI